MKKRWAAISAASVLLLTGCVQKTVPTDREQVYISFFGVGYTTGPETLAEILHPVWEEALETHMDLSNLDMLYVSGEQFQQFVDYGVYDGTCQGAEDGVLQMQYQAFSLNKSDVDMPEDFWTGAEQEMQSYMEQANRQQRCICPSVENQFVASGTYAGTAIIRPPKIAWQPPTAYIHDSENGWIADRDLWIWPKLKLLKRDNILVTEQHGYTLKESEHNQSFVISYDNTAYAEPEDTVQMELAFHSDGTWETENRNGSWEMEDGVLAFYASEMGDSNTGICLLYLDFETGQIYLPIYLRCDSLLESLHQIQQIGKEP